MIDLPNHPGKPGWLSILNWSALNVPSFDLGLRPRSKSHRLCRWSFTFRVSRNGSPVWLLLCLILILLPILPDFAHPASESDTEVLEWVSRVRSNPGDYDAWKALGEYLFETGDLNKSIKCYSKVLNHNSMDSEALYYVGRIQEALNKPDTALRFYAKHTELPANAPFKDEMDGRYRILRRDQIRKEMKTFLQQESALQTVEASPQTVAVMPLQYVGKDTRFIPLGKGLSEMLMTDLSQVPGIFPVERIRVQALMDEINLGQTGLIEESTAPRFGKMVGAGKMVHGSFDIEGTRMQVDVSYADVLNNVISDPIQLAEGLQQMFLMEKDLAFQIIDNMGIELTPEQRSAIQHIPTTNLQAFMAYCLGLEMEDRGQFDQASAYYQKAVKLDPGFQQATFKVAESRTLIAATRPPRRQPPGPARPGSRPPGRRPPQNQPAGQAQRPGTAQTQPSALLPPPTLSQQALVNNRLININQNLGAVVIPSAETRNPTVEAAVSNSEPILEDLPLPPDLPDLNALR